MVYSDWLLERNHPRGELIQLGPLAKAGDRQALQEIQRIEIDEDPLLSPRLAARGRQWRFELYRGFIRLAEFQTYGDTPADAEAVAALCADPHVGLAESIALEVVSYRGPADARTGLGQRVYSRIDVGDLDRELAALRWLDSLEVHGVACPELTHRNLRRLAIDSSTGSDTRIDLPALETLEWHAISPEAGFGMVVQASFPRLREIILRDGDEDLLAVLTELPIARQLQSLTLRTLEPALVVQLAAHATAFRGLDKIVIDGVLEEARPLEESLQRAYPVAKISVRSAYLPRRAAHREQREVAEVDEQSRRPDGTIDAAARFGQRR